MRTRRFGPFPFPSGDPNDPSEAPLEVSLTQAMRWYHVVKTWDITMTWTNSPGITISGNTDVMAQNQLGPSATPVANETELSQWYYFNEQGPNDHAVPNPSFCQLSLFRVNGQQFPPNTPFASFFPQIAFPRITAEAPEGLWKPFLIVLGQFGTARNQVTTSAAPGVFGTPVLLGGFTGTFDGLPLNFYWFPAGNPNPEPQGSITITPSTYWEHAKADGTAPIDNETTGVQLLPSHQEDELPLLNN